MCLSFLIFKMKRMIPVGMDFHEEYVGSYGMGWSSGPDISWLCAWGKLLNLSVPPFPAK